MSFRAKRGFGLSKSAEARPWGRGGLRGILFQLVEQVPGLVGIDFDGDGLVQVEAVDAEYGFRVGHGAALPQGDGERIVVDEIGEALDLRGVAEKDIEGMQR